MRVLILGGTQFVGRHLAEEVQRRGHEMTLFHRGKTHAGLFPKAMEIHGDRDGGLGALEGLEFDWVLDTCGYVPRVVQASVRALSGRTPRYLFVSTVSVYASFDQPGLTEEAEVAVIEDPETETIDARTYGALKALCETEVLEAFGDNALIPRPGIIAGPYDPTDRFTYWVGRAGRDEDYLAPKPDSQPMQLIDARDLAHWMVDQIEADRRGVFNTAGPKDVETFGTMVAACARATNGGAKVRWVGPEWLKEQSVHPSKELPLWLGPGNNPGLFQVDSSRAQAAGLLHRGLSQTAMDTWRWMNTWPTERTCSVGLTVERESELISALDA